MIKRIYLLQLIVFFMFTSNICFANDNKITMDTTKEIVLLEKLYVSDGAGEYFGYQKLNGYPNENEFQIYFQDNSRGNIISYIVKYDDLRNIDINEVWAFSMPDGSQGKLSRGEVNRIFLLYSGTQIEQHLRSIFPGAYNDWYNSMFFSQDAERLVDKYLKYKNSTKSTGRFTTPEITHHNVGNKKNS